MYIWACYGLLQDISWSKLSSVEQPHQFIMLLSSDVSILVSAFYKLQMRVVLLLCRVALGLCVCVCVSVSDIAIDWSDHGLWWPDKNIWLARTRSTLDQYGVQADAKLWFTPMHKNLRIMLPDLQVIDMPVNFSTNVFTNVIRVCKELGKFGSFEQIKHSSSFLLPEHFHLLIIVACY